jgi:hypothetical protein
MASLLSKPGITNASFGNSVPSQWSQSWFQNLIKTGLQLADVRNAVGVNGIVVSGNISQYATISLGTPIILPAPVPGTYALQVNGADGYYTERITGSSTSGQSYGLKIIAGTTGVDNALNITNYARTETFVNLAGDGSGLLGYNSNGLNTITWNAAGNVSIAAPLTGSTFTAAAAIAAGAPAITTPGFYASSAAASVQYQMSASGPNYGYFGTIAARTWSMGYTSSSGVAGTEVMRWSDSTAAGAVYTFGAASQYSLVVDNTAAAGTSYGLLVQAGKNTADYCARFLDGTQTYEYFRISGTGVKYFYAPTNGDISTNTYGVSGNYASLTSGNPAANASYGLLVEAGTSASDDCAYFTNYGNTIVYFQIVGSGLINMPNIGTTAAAANATFSGASNTLQKSTSSVRYKKNVRDVDAKIHDALTQLRPIVYNSAVESDPQDLDYFGLIAEEVEKVEPRLVTYTEELLGFDPHPTVPHKLTPRVGAKRPDGVQYERLTVLLLAAFQKLRAEVDALKASQK